MATPGEMVRLVGQALGVDEAQVVQQDRILAVNKFRTVGGRGRSAASMQARDIAALLIAVAASPRVADTAAAFQTYSSMRVGGLSSFKSYEGDEMEIFGDKCWNLGSLDLPELRSLPEDHTSLDALTALLQVSASEALPKSIDSMDFSGGLDDWVGNPFITVDFHWPFPRVVIDVNLPEFREVKEYGEITPEARPLRLDGDTKHTPVKHGDLTRVSSFTIRTILSLSDLLKS